MKDELESSRHNCKLLQVLQVNERRYPSGSFLIHIFQGILFIYQTIILLNYTLKEIDLNYSHLTGIGIIVNSNETST